MNRLNMTRYAVTHPVGIIMIVLFFVTLGLYTTTVWGWNYIRKSIRPMW